MSRRKTRKPVIPRIEVLETRQMLSTADPARPVVLPFAASTRHDGGTMETLAPRPDLDGFAQDLLRHPRAAARRGLTALGQDLAHHRGLVARDGAGAVLAWILERHPAYAQRHGLAGLLQPPQPAPGPVLTPVPSVPMPTGGPIPTGPSTPTNPPAPSPPAPTAPSGGTTAPPVTTLPQLVPVGTTLNLQVPAAGLDPALTTYAIAPQPLPDNMTFYRQTGALQFTPDPGEVGQSTYTITATDGTHSATVSLPITVVNQPTPTTELSGQVVDESGEPLAGVPVMIETNMVDTGSDGRFTLAGVPAMHGPLMIDGQHADDAGSRMMLMAPADQVLGHAVYGGVDNIVPAPIVLPKVDLAHATDFSQIDPSQPHDLTSPLLPGVVLHVSPNSARTTSGTPFTGKLSLTNLPVDQLKEVLPPGMLPGSLIGVDGPDLIFSTPTTLTLPNTANLAPGTMMSLLSMNLTTGGFDVTGQMQVSADGRRLVTAQGGISDSSCIMVLILCKQNPIGTGSVSGGTMGMDSTWAARWSWIRR